MTYAMTKKAIRRRKERIQHAHAHGPTCSVLLSAQWVLSAICDLRENHRKKTGSRTASADVNV